MDKMGDGLECSECKNDINESEAIGIKLGEKKKQEIGFWETRYIFYVHSSHINGNGVSPSPLQDMPIGTSCRLEHIVAAYPGINGGHIPNEEGAVSRGSEGYLSLSDVKQHLPNTFYSMVESTPTNLIPDFP